MYRSEHNPLISPTDFPGGIADSVMNCGQVIHDGKVLLLDLEDPSKIIGKMESWILTPQADYERLGNVNNVVFACGALADEEKDEIRVYYGAADEHVCLATGSLSELIDACKKGI